MVKKGFVYKSPPWNNFYACMFHRVSLQSLPCIWITAVAYVLKRLPTTCTCVSCSASFSGKRILSYFWNCQFCYCPSRFGYKGTYQNPGWISFRYQQYNYIMKEFTSAIVIIYYYLFTFVQTASSTSVLLCLTLSLEKNQTGLYFQTTVLSGL